MQNPPMSPILAVGATPAQAHTVWHWLQQQGVSPARASRREQLLPEALSELMARTERKTTGPAAATQLQHKLWAELATDLLLANVDQQRWGWAQPLVRTQIDFWLDFDPGVQLALGYASPLAALRLLLQSGHLPSDELVDTTLSQWQQHSSALLACHYQHRQRSVLINTEAVAAPSEARHAAAVAEALGLACPETGAITGGAHTNVVVAPMAPLANLDDQLEACLLNDMLARSPAAAALFQELEAAAHWPALAPLTPPEPPSLAALWQLQRQRAAEHQGARSALATALAQCRAAAQHQDQLMQAQAEKQAGEQAQLSQQLDLQTQAFEATKTSHAALQTENELLLAQLHQVQEELEKLFNQHAELEQAHKAGQAEKAEQAGRAQELARAHADAGKKLKAVEAQLPTAHAHTQAQQQQIKELSEENELLLTQLHHVQEELEHYFLQLKQARQTQQIHQAEQAPLAFECAFWHRHSPAEVWVDLRQDIAGQGWYEAEADGRWTGPELTSTLRLPPLAPGRYTLELHLADAIQPELVSGLVVEATRDDGSAIQAIELLHEFGAGASLYPMVSLGELTLPALEAPWSLRLTLPYNQSPAEQGGADTRRLGLRVQGLRLSAADTAPEPMHYVDEEPAATTAVPASASTH